MEVQMQMRLVLVMLHTLMSLLIVHIKFSDFSDDGNKH